MKINVQILGRGMAGSAMARALSVVQEQNPQIKLNVRVLGRADACRFTSSSANEKNLLCIATPHGLHAEGILRGAAAGADAIVSEKPVCISAEQAAQLAKVRVPTAVCHGYRVMWGPKTVLELLKAGELGDIITIEGGYWQSSSAARALTVNPPPMQAWKNDPSLSGGFDALIDIGSHWMDLVLYLAGEKPKRGQAWLSYRNSEAAHRDTHALISLDFSSGIRAQGSISKTVHGAANDFRIVVLGTKASVSWAFMQPDEIRLGQGSKLSLIRRTESLVGSKQRPFHGLGWLEGYVEILGRVVEGLAADSDLAHELINFGVPTLAEASTVIQTILALDRLA